ncbi:MULTISPECIES: twin-arginine translocation signal domain-containing protein [Halomonadaceae]|uniref:twin-arginine translocation signal domain-containing protein n=1 Tax=Halomonadaceae TaxID=28256 RepID=UPI001583AEB4|nr:MULTISPECIES: twin-arginine translocation signal domain-containing protein [Halomonas]MDI4638391.1 twin-arginine translocation signal domain-containing protein [Halomonas sp. BMC7]NUJ59379.1 twin-arginine translocation signal domain-containing protein [Halomonas taeanensis]
MAQHHNPQRRLFLKTVGTGTAAAGAIFAIGQPPLVQAKATPSTAPDAPRGYRETDHIRRYYATLRD